MSHTDTTLTLAPPESRLRSRHRPIRVCFLIDDLARAGTESQLLALIEHLDRSRVEPMLCLLKGTSAASRALEPASCPVVRLGVRSLHHLSSLRKAMRLARLLREWHADVLQVYFPDSTLFGVPVARWAGVSCVVRTRNNLGYSSTRLQRWLGRLYSRFVSATVANCEACRQTVLAMERPAPDSVVVVENGVDLARYQRARVAVPGKAKGFHHVGMVANLRPIKQPEILLQAASMICAARSDVVVRIAGEGELRLELEREIERRGLTARFLLPGATSHVPAFLAELDVAVLCSRSEGQSNALLEYMAAGRAIVATDVGGNRELIEPETNGLLVPPGDPAQLAEAILRLLADAPLAARLGAAARHRVEERYSLPARARRFEEFYQRLLRS